MGIYDSWNYGSGHDGWRNLIIVIVVIFCIVWVVNCMGNRVDMPLAIEQTEMLTGKKVVETIRSSNASLIFGDAWDATWQFRFSDGSVVSTRCWGSDFSQPICRVYSAGAE